MTSLLSRFSSCNDFTTYTYGTPSFLIGIDKASKAPLCKVRVKFLYYLMQFIALNSDRCRVLNLYLF